MPIVRVTGQKGARKEDFFEVDASGRLDFRVSKKAWEESKGKLQARPVFLKDSDSGAFDRVKISK